MRYYGRRRKYSKKTVRKSRPTVRRAIRKVKKSNFVKAVKAVIHSQAEDKQVFIQSGNNLTYFNSGINAVGDMLQIVPAVTQGTGDSNRSGDQIRSKNLNVKGFVRLVTNEVADSTALPQVMVRLMVVSMKQCSSYNATAFGPALAQLLRKGNTTSAFSGVLSDLYAPINTDAWTVHHDQKFYLNQSYMNAQGSSPPSTYLMHDIKNTIKFFNINVKCKNKLLKYDSGVNSGQTPVNFAPYLLLGYAYLDGTTSGDVLNTNVGMNYITTMNFEDL